MDVTEQVLERLLTYGSSDSTNPDSLSASKKLNYAVGSSISNPEVLNLAVLPFTFKFEDSVGLFGSENHYVKVNLNTDFRLSNQDKAVIENDYLGGTISVLDAATGITTGFGQRPEPVQPYGDPAELDYSKDEITVNTFEPAFLKFGIAPLFDGFMSVRLDNLGTGNIYVDTHLDVSFYDRDREEHPFDDMYIRGTDFFYIGFHARHKSRLPYKIDCIIGEKILDRQDIPEGQIAKGSRTLHNTTFSEVPAIV